MIKVRLVVVIFLGVIMITGSTWLAPRALALHHQVRGGQLLADVLATFSEGDDVPMACMLSAPVDPEMRAQLAEAISYLQAALHYDQTLAQAYLLLGRAYCLTGDYQKAISAYQAFTRLRTGNPLGHLELAFAYQKNMANPSGLELTDDELRALMLTELSAAGVDSADLVPQALEAFLRQKYWSSIGFFEIADSLDVAMSASDEVLWYMAMALCQQDLSRRNKPTDVPLYPLENSVRIEATDMVWLRRGEMLGKPMRDFPSRGLDGGVFRWNGASSFIVEVAQPGEFRLSMLAQHTPPAPIHLQVEHNFIPIFYLELIREDMSWQEFETDVYLNAGPQLVSIRFTNNRANVDGINRRAVVSWVILERKWQE